MAVFRVERNTGYTVMSNHHLRNKELSLSFWGVIFTEIPQAMSIMACCIGYFNTVGR